jgi:hypothetical protein
VLKGLTSIASAGIQVARETATQGMKLDLWAVAKPGSLGDPFPSGSESCVAGRPEKQLLLVVGRDLVHQVGDIVWQLVGRRLAAALPGLGRNGQPWALPPVTADSQHGGDSFAGIEEDT